jgi:hypothetical protein
VDVAYSAPSTATVGRYSIDLVVALTNAPPDFSEARTTYALDITGWFITNKKSSNVIDIKALS